MKRELPVLCGETLTYQHTGVARTLRVGTPDWERWLADAEGFVVSFEDLTFTVRKERAGNQRGEWYWRAYHKHRGKLRRVYVGKVDRLSLTRLQEVGGMFAESARQGKVVAESEQTAQRFLAAHQAYRRLLATKLFIPPVPPRIVPRLSLFARRYNLLAYRVTLLAAPAGFGKTTLLSEWVQALREASPKQVPASGTRSGSVAVGWVSLDESDNDPASFWSYLIEALNKVQNGIGDSSLELLSSARPPALTVILTVLINALIALPGTALLVFDDYHLIETPTIHEGMSYFLENLPPQVHVVIASRSEPPLPLARWRASRLLQEIHTADLRFSLEETRAFFAEVAGRRLETETLEHLDGRIEGWVAGLQLAALALQAYEDSATFIKSFTGNHRHVLDYLVAEVFSRQTEQVQQFLLLTCVLKRMNASLCNAMTGQDNGQEMLTLLERKKLFLLPLDQQRQWYRYHHLFAEVVQTYLQQLHADWITELHRRASNWFEQQGLVAQAIDHALQAEEFIRAANFIEGIAESDPTIWNLGEAKRLQQWLGALPTELVEARPPLHVLRLWVILRTTPGDDPHFLTSLDSGVREIEHACNLDPSLAERRSMMGTLAAIDGVISYLRGDAERAGRQALIALDLLPQKRLALLVVAVQTLINVYRISGDSAIARRVLNTLESISENRDDIYSALGVMYHLGQLQMFQGDIRKAATTYRKAIVLAEQTVLEATPAMYVELANILLEWNQLEEASTCVARAIANTQQRSDPGIKLYCYEVLAHLKWVEGDIAAAFAALDCEEEVLHQYRHLFQTTLGEAMQRHIAGLCAWLHLMAGNLAAANAWAEKSSVPEGEVLDYYRRFDLIVLARIYLANGQPAKALQIIEQLPSTKEATANQNHLVSLLALRVVVLSANGDEVQARAMLGRLLAIAEPGGYIRSIIDEGPVMVGLLQELLASLQAAGNQSSSHVSRRYVEVLLTAAGRRVSTREQHETRANQALLSPDHATPLSQREGEILRLMAQGMSDREIADCLILSENTIKTYARRIYAKLDVRNRTQAVRRAGELHIL